MRMSELFRKRVFQAGVGGSVTRTRSVNRRHTLYFSGIFINYIKACEDSSYTEEMREIGRKWMLLFFTNLVPGAAKKLPLFILNNIMRKMWIATNLMEDFHIKEKDGLIEIRTKKEAVTKAIGENQFSVGLFIGICNALFKSEVDIISIFQTRDQNKYVFRLRNKPPCKIKSKSKEDYERLNSLSSIKGFTLDYALKKKILHLKDGKRIFFRGRPVNLVENTLFHLIGNKNILFKTIPEISYNFFIDVIEDSPPEKKLRLIKTILQIMGWGSIRILLEGSEIIFEIKNPPHGIQGERDNWNFLAMSILGYLWLLDRKIRIKDISESDRGLRITYGSCAIEQK
jgi:hypothetical protein